MCRALVHLHLHLPCTALPQVGGGGVMSSLMALASGQQEVPTTTMLGTHHYINIGSEREIQENLENVLKLSKPH